MVPDSSKLSLIEILKWKLISIMYSCGVLKGTNSAYVISFASDLSQLLFILLKLLTYIPSYYFIVNFFNFFQTMIFSILKSSSGFLSFLNKFANAMRRIIKLFVKDRFVVFLKCFQNDFNVFLSTHELFTDWRFASTVAWLVFWPIIFKLQTFAIFWEKKSNLRALVDFDRLDERSVVDNIHELIVNIIQGFWLNSFFARCTIRRSWLILVFPKACIKSHRFYSWIDGRTAKHTYIFSKTRV